ncbi:MAG TPA: hypothetical protein DEO86_01140 [Colwellia sp.]|jgi:hypothetical protein|nr:hypothetical protein [Colwellia sp.]|tara:strand:- start:1870 stop:2052 length:183 start_codon:yes stop_codon:yes gene_type:complete
MNSLTHDESNYLNATGLEHTEVAVNENKHPTDTNTQQHVRKHEQTLCSDVSTASYVRGYN